MFSYVFPMHVHSSCCVGFHLTFLLAFLMTWQECRENIEKKEKIEKEIERKEEKNPPTSCMLFSLNKRPLACYRRGGFFKAAILSSAWCWRVFNLSSNCWWRHQGELWRLFATFNSWPLGLFFVPFIWAVNNLRHVETCRDLSTLVAYRPRVRGCSIPNG